MGALSIRLAVVGVLAALVASCSGTSTPTASPSPEPSATPTASETPSSSPPATNTPSSTPTRATDLEDGRHPAFITKVRPSQRTITIDVVQWFTGDAASSAAAEDGAEEVPPPNDYWIRNENPKLRTLEVPEGTVIITNTLTAEETGDSFQDVHVTLEKLATLDYKRSALFWITIRDGEVVRIRQQYLP